MEDVNVQGKEHQVRFLDSTDKWSIRVLEDLSNTRIQDVFLDCILRPDGGVTVQVSDKVAYKLSKKIRSAVIDTVPKYVRAEVSEALDDNKFDEKFQILHNLGEKFKDRSKKAWRPPLDAKQHMRAARVKIKEEQLKILKFVISIKKENIERLKEKARSSSETSIKTGELFRQIHEETNSALKKHHHLMESLDTYKQQLAELRYF